MRTYRDAKPMAKSLRKELAQRNIPLTHGDCLEIVARQFGLPDWNVLSARLEASACPAARGLARHRSRRERRYPPAGPRPGVALIESLLDEDLSDRIAVLM